MSEYSIVSASGGNLARRSDLQAAIRRRNELSKQHGNSLTIIGPDGKPVPEPSPSGISLSVKPSFLPSYAK